MKKTMNTLSRITGLLLFSFSIMIVGCSDQDESLVEAPSSDDLSMSYTVDAENPNLIHFVGQASVDHWYVHWNFGDNTGKEGFEVSKTYFTAGEYEVRFKIFTEGGTASITETIVIENDFQGNDLIKNGSLESEDFWTVFSISPGITAEISEGVATWNGGSWGNAGIYQTIDIEAGVEYQVNMDVAGGGLSDCWFEIFIGSVQPQDGVDYSSGGILMAINTWEGCGTDDFVGQLSDIACVGEGGVFSWDESGQAFFVIKSGGANLGTNGITVDNISIREL